MPTLAINKRAYYDYEIKDKFEVGIMILGHEVKSVKTGHINLKGSYVTLKKNQKRTAGNLFNKCPYSII